MCALFHYRRNNIPFFDSLESATIFIRRNITCRNKDALFSDNSGGYAGALFIQYFGSITNKNCTFINNEGYSGAIRALHDVNVMNNESRFIGNQGKWGGAIYLRYHVQCTNINSTFQENLVSESGGAIYGRYDVQVINTGSRFLSNRGGAIYMRDRATCRNTESMYVENSASSRGGAITVRYDADLVNIRSEFISNIAEQGGSLNIGYQATSLNIDCLFQDNFASKSGGVMALWYGVNCTNINCNFTKNKGIQFYYNIPRDSPKSVGSFIHIQLVSIF